MLRTRRVPAVVALAVLSASCAQGPPRQAEILWDTWGVNIAHHAHALDPRGSPHLM